MVEVKHIYRDGKRVIHDTLDLRDCKQPYNFTDRITVGKENNHTFNLTEEDFEYLYQKKINEK